MLSTRGEAKLNLDDLLTAGLSLFTLVFLYFPSRRCRVE